MRPPSRALASVALVRRSLTRAPTPARIHSMVRARSRVMQRPLAILAWALLVGCGSEDSGDGAGGAGGLSCTPPEVPIHAPTSGEIVCGGVDEDTEVVPHSDFDACAEPPNSACNVEDFCAIMQCGDPNSGFDAQGCRRTTCANDADCEPGQVCHDTYMQGCVPSAGYACAPATDGVCHCPANAACGFEQHCVESTELDG